jgi:hypothetical protein
VAARAEQVDVEIEQAVEFDQDREDSDIERAP